MHVPPSPGGPGETEILTGPAGEPGKPRRSRRSQRRSGPAIAAFSVLAAALLGGGVVFAVVNGDQDGPGAPPARAPESTQEAAQNPEPDQNVPQEEKQKPEKESNTASGGDDTSTGGAGTDAGTGTDRTGQSEPGADSAAGKPAADKPSQQQSSPQKPQEVPDDPRADGATGYVHPQGPIGG
ncbi:hypothetical protein ABT061_05960 [Streptosporangium sp. NPDC002544]|uniref:hypothetical protein n=1 Tax=Streptosporangium sp. NPDC002544 TaxID=3154538 RepID=UPI003324C9C6